MIPLIPFAMLARIIGMGLFLLFIGVIWPFLVIQASRRQRQFRNAMKSKGRFAALLKINPKLLAGEGTLLEEIGLKGPFRIWWTEDDIFSLGSPVSTQEELISILKGDENPFNTQCLKEYLDEESGKALLTPISTRYAKTGKLAEMFPKMKVAKIVRPFPPPDATHKNDRFGVA